MKNLFLVCSLFLSFSLFAQTVPMVNNAPWYKFTNKLTVKGRLQIPGDTTSGYTAIDTNLIAIKSGMFYYLDTVGGIFKWNPVSGGGAVTSLTTTGTSGVATLGGGVLNIPNYTKNISNGLSLSGDTIKLGGALTGNTSITGAFTLTLNPDILRLWGNTTELGGAVALTSYTTISQGSDVNNLTALYSRYHMNPTIANVNITGISGGTSGKILYFFNESSTNTITLKNESSSSTASNRFSTGSDVLIAAGSAVLLMYDTDGSRNRWIVVGGNSTGGSSTPTLTTSSATSLTLGGSETYVFTGSGSATWTLPAIGTTGKRYFIKSRGTATLTIQRAGSNQLYTNTTTISINLLQGDAVILQDDGTYWIVM